MIQLKNVSLNIHEHIILSKINYHVKPGDFVIVLGSNGSGKSSLLKLIDQRYHPSAGSILIDNKPLKNYSNKSLSRIMITLTQNCHDSLFSSLTLLENYLLVEQKYSPNLFAISTKKARIFLHDYLMDFNKNLAKKLDTLVENLSGGEKQAFALALSVLHPPKILLLDEHTSALDPKSGHQLMELTERVVKTYGITCLLTTHDLTLARDYGQRIIALQNGKICQTIDEAEKKTLNQEQLLKLCY